MRIISGKYGRRRFQVPSNFKARPTTDFAKENLFNVLVNIFDWENAVALDLFAGTGSISFEMISRGCSRVVSVENDRIHTAFIEKVAKELKTDELNLIRGDVFRFLATAKSRSYDFIFADPPYSLPQLSQIPEMIINKNLLRDGGMFVMEHSEKNDFSHLPLFNRRKAYGSVNFSIFVKRGDLEF
ncbi:MAG: RsmD family RNA methyltransferase [Tannerella sp.]|jgi:16S rRNA (guanine(966)-N(2))-methyltransferase RsmD|nr:RsmD family RNA methyltransferase [Tannerella sp.]